MSPQTGTALLILAAFVLPGFVALRARESTLGRPPDDPPFERLLTVLLSSTVVYALALSTGAVLGLDTADLAALFTGRKPLPS